MQEAIAQLLRLSFFLARDGEYAVFRLACTKLISVLSATTSTQSAHHVDRIEEQQEEFV
jgi:hypothetical protein